MNVKGINNMVKTLKGKISLVYLGLVLLIAIVGITASYNLFKLSHAIDGLMIANYKSINSATNMIDAIERQDSAVLIYINVDTQKGKALFAENNEEFLKWYNINASNITEKGEKEIVETIETSYAHYMKLFWDLQEIRSKHGNDKAAIFYNKRMMPDFINTKKELKQLSLLNEKAMFKSKELATKNAHNSMYIVFALSIFAIIGGYIASRFFSNKFLMPIYSLTKTMRLVKAGDLNQRANVISKDEVGELATEFNNMTKRLLQYEHSTLGNLLSEKNKSLAIVKSISDPLIVLDTSHKVLLINDACEKIFNVKEHKIINKHYLEGINNKEIFDFITSTFNLKDESRQKIFMINSDNEDYYYNVVVATVKDNDANITEIVVVFQNVTHLKELEKIRTDFIATISHEFKTPLTSIVLGTDMLMNEGMGLLNDEQAQFVNAIREDSDRLTKLVNDLLELTRIESGKAVYKFQNYSLVDIIECAVKPFYHFAEKNSIRLNYQYEDNMPLVAVDFEKIIWVLNNLISNALKYTYEGDEISINAAVKAGKVFVTVRDTGTGIPEEYLEKIFEKFVQVQDGDFELRGTGLGLAVVKEIIKAHDGEIWCESKLEAGSSFTFTLNIPRKETSL
jgi:signal transduction histidine kinase